jgi:hypothetical protein
MKELDKEKDNAILEEPCSPRYPPGLPLICSKKKILADENTLRGCSIGGIQQGRLCNSHPQNHTNPTQNHTIKNKLIAMIT